MRGTTEVAGSRAEVILANPNGITCEGCGFINTSRSVLTTGTPVFGGDGSLAAYRVSGGQISIDSAGLDGRNLDQLDLIARSVVIRGSVWSGDSLNVIAGANQVSHDGLTVTPIAGEGIAPAWGIDTALTGGMYSQKIRLLVTEAGVGVRHAGTLVAQGGDFQLDAAGQITLTGKVDAGGQINIQTSANLDNSGTVYGSSNLNMTSGGQINNTGLLAAAGDIRLAAVSLDSSGNLAAGVDRDGKVTQGSNLTATTTGLLKATGQNLAGNSLWFEGGQLQLSGAKTSAQGSITLKASQGSIDHTGGILQSGSDLILNSTGRLINDGAQLNVGGQLALTVAGLSNRGGQIAQIGTAQNGRIESNGDLDNQGGSIISNASLTLQAAQFDNQGGKVQVQNDADLDMLLTGTLDNRNNGQIAVTGTTQLEAEAVLNNGGSITAGQDLFITTLQQIDNHQGTLAALKNVEFVAGELNNQAGVIASVEGNTDIALYGGTLSNTLNNTQGNISAGNDLSLDALSVINQGGTLYAKQDVSLFADQYSGNGILLANRDMSILLLGDYTQSATNLIQANRHLDFWLSGDLINEGTLGAVGTLTLDASRIDNRAGGLLQGDTTELWATQINNAGTLIGNTLRTDSITFSNTGRVFGQDIEINADALGNQGTGVIAAGNTLNLYIATLLDNLDGALLYSMGNLSIAASSERDDNGRLKDFTLSVLNSSADIQAEGDLEISALVLDNRRTDIVTDTRTLSESTTLVQERDNDWAASEIGRIYVNGPTVKQETLTQVCRQDGTCQTTTATEYITVERFTSETLANQVGIVTSNPVENCIGPVCTWTTTTVISTVSNAYGADEWYLPEASDLSTFIVLDLQRGGRRYVQQNTDTQEYIVSATPEARILAGRNLYLNAGVVNNEASRIEATGSLIADVGVLNNVGVTLSNKIRETLWIGKCSDIQASVAGVLGYCGHG
ncbi:MAG: filamentous hemagglutinin N-terminal domain-containing protein, partial [Azovibrio sp.]